jgi:ubiquinone/menaquinone biosynthesis C-methylase UbiE
VIDWNLAFDLIFEPIVGELRGRHVNWFIARLANSEEVFTHARGFPTRTDQQPNVDTEPLVYVTARYGVIEFEKVATKLHDRDGRQRGWAVTLLVRKAGDFDALIRDLAARIETDKFWSLYSVSYDLVLNRYPRYNHLLEQVNRSVPDEARRVLDLGAGTGNMARRLLEGGRDVWAVEKNIAMLDILRAKDFAVKAQDRLKIVKSSVEHLEMLAAEEPFDAATAVNVLYAVDNVPACLASVSQVLKPGGALVLTTTDSKTELTPLLDDIRKQLNSDRELIAHVDRVRELNFKLQAQGLTTRYTREQYVDWLKAAGFAVDSDERAYVDAVLLIRAHKREDSVAPAATPVAAS